MKYKKVSIAGFEAHAKTKQEATAILHRQIEKATEGDYTPLLLQSGRETLIVWREPHNGWVYCTWVWMPAA